MKQPHGEGGFRWGGHFSPETLHGKGASGRGRGQERRAVRGSLTKSYKE